MPSIVDIHYRDLRETAQALYPALAK